MTVTYLIQSWDKQSRKYVDLWTGHDFSWAIKMFNKPYNRIHTRRLVKIEVHIIKKGKADKR